MIVVGRFKEFGEITCIGFILIKFLQAKFVPAVFFLLLKIAGNLCLGDFLNKSETTNTRVFSAEIMCFNSGPKLRRAQLLINAE